MIQVLQTIGIGVLTYLVYKLVDLTINRFKSGKVRLRIAPKNFFEYLQPGCSIGKVKEILGEPTIDTAGTMIFKLEDLLVQIQKEDEKIQTICAVLPKFRFFNKYRIYPLSHKLGSVKIKDIIKEHSKIEYETSSKSGNAWIIPILEIRATIIITLSEYLMDRVRFIDKDFQNFMFRLMN